MKSRNVKGQIISSHSHANKMFLCVLGFLFCKYVQLMSMQIATKIQYTNAELCSSDSKVDTQ